MVDQVGVEPTIASRDLGLPPTDRFHQLAYWPIKPLWLDGTGVIQF